MHTPSPPVRDLVVIGASTGGIEALSAVVAGLPSGFPAAVLIVMHIGPHDSILPALLARSAVLPVRHAHQDEPLVPGRILVAPPDLHLTVSTRGAARARLSRSARENHTRPAIDPLFRSAALAFGARAIGVVLTGALDDGTAGLAAIKACGGQAVVQDPDGAVAAQMPASAIEKVDVDRVLKLHEIAPALVEMVDANLRVPVAEPAARPPRWLELEHAFTVKEGDMTTLEPIAVPSTYTCPECHGTLWQLKEGLPHRFRCHTGHAFTEKNLVSLQKEAVEDSIWSAVRALQEREKLLRSLADDALRHHRKSSAMDYLAEADRVARNADILRQLISETRPVDTVPADETV